MKSNKINLLIVVILFFQLNSFAKSIKAKDSTTQRSNTKGSVQDPVDANSPSKADAKAINEIDSILQQNLTPEPESSEDASETHNRPLTTRDQKKLNISDYSKLISRTDYEAYNVLQKNPMVKSSHFQLNMGVTKVINDGFNSNFGLHLAGLYHFNETWGVGLGGTVLSSSRSSQTKNLQEVQLINVDQLWTLKNTYNASLYVTPIYGKWTLLNQKILPFEIYFSVGAAQVTDQSNKSISATSASIGQLISLSQTSAFDINLQGLAYTAKNINNEDQAMNSVLLTLSYSLFWSMTE